MSTMRYGLIGTGGMGHGHIGALKPIDGVELVAAADSFAESRDRARETLEDGIPIYSTHADMLADETLDAVIIATPDDTHATIVCDCLSAGCHVLSEKPMATTVEDCNRVLQAASEARGIYQVGLELRYAAVWRRVRELVEAGTIGRVRQLWCKEFRGPWNLKVEQWITQQEHTGGALNEKDCHHFDLFNWFCGDRPARVAAFGTRDLVYGAERFKGVTPTVLDNAQTIVQYEHGAVAALMLCMFCTGYKEGLEIGVIGTDGWLTAHSGRQNTLTWTRREDGQPNEETFDLPETIRRISHGGAVYLEHLAFLDNIRRQKQPLTNADAAWWSTIVPLAAEKAVQEHRVVQIDEFGPAPSFGDGFHAC